jgi:hypothetical protein
MREWNDFFAPAAAEFLIAGLGKTPCPPLALTPSTAEAAGCEVVDLTICRAMVLVPGSSLLEHAKLSVLYGRLAAKNSVVQLAAFMALSRLLRAEPVVLAHQVKVRPLPIIAL